jgi:hypothetical protein
MAAAAIASGALALAGAGVTAGVLTGAATTGIATATGLGVAATMVFCCVETSASADWLVVEVASPEDGFLDDFVPSVFDAPNFPLERGGGLPPAVASALEDCRDVALPPVESAPLAPFALLLFDGPVLADELLADDELSPGWDDDDGADWSGGAATGVLPVSGVLSSSDEKPPVPGEESGRA